MTDTYIILNEKLLKANEPSIMANNRAFRYGDVLFESMRIVNGKVQFLPEHIERLKIGMQLLKMEIPSHFNWEYFSVQIKNLTDKNIVGQDARIRMTIYRNEGFFYTPLTNEVSFLIEAESINFIGYELNSKGYIIDVFPDLKKSLNILSTIKSSNCLASVLGAIYKKKQNLDECIILNEKGNIAEAISSNIFAVKNGVLYTPPISDGCVDGIMRKQIIRIAKENKNAVYEVTIAMNVLLGADELFLTNSITGIQWIAAYKGKRYFNTTSKLLVDKLNLSLI